MVRCPQHAPAVFYDVNLVVKPHDRCHEISNRTEIWQNSAVKYAVRKLRDINYGRKLVCPKIKSHEK